VALLEKWSQSRELDRFRREVDELLERFGLEHHWLRNSESASLRPAIESFIDGDKLTVRVDLPGIDPKSVDVRVVGGFLTLKGTRQEKQETRNTHYYIRETRYGSFERTIQLPQGVKHEGLKATYKNGVLELTATIPKEAAPRQVKVEAESAEGGKSAGGRKAG
jgi:HSP20 family protein